jgi:hypothetical protein
MVEQQDVFYYVTLMNENYAQPSLPEGVREEILRGAYLFNVYPAKKETAQATLLGSGAILTEVIKAAITKQFHLATAKGDLDATEKSQAALENFERAGELPSGSEMKTAVNAAVADYKRAKEQLSKAYEAVVKALTIEKKIAEAKLARQEKISLDQTAEQADAITDTSPKKGENVAAALVGTWTITYSNGTTRTYTILQTGEVLFNFNEERARGNLTWDGSTFLLDFQDGKIERLKLQGRTLLVEHFNPASRLRINMRDCTGTGRKD